jgi:PAS domain-containing protein|tara:strand:+ start:3374 stop:3949 length:576 start_codon:yes stop_codon:yes gene_type:complete
MITPEFAGAVATLVGAGIAILAFVWRIFKVTGVFLKDHEEIKVSIETIRAEVTPNSGKSLKDTVNSLKKTCDRIETRQKVLDQRSKAALHYSDRPLFETDVNGRLTWCNASFQELTKDNGSCKEGFDWLTVIDDDRREDFLKEFNSCLKMCRKIDIETVSVHGRIIHFVGYPYTVDTDVHEGFLIHLYKGE